MIDIQSDSRKIKPGDTFIAVKCEVNDGHKYIDTAIKAGAKKIIAERGEYSVPTEIVPNTRKYLEDYLKNNYNKYLEEMTIIGITGTNGKTTSAYLLYQALNKLGEKTAYMGTIGFYLDKKICSLPNTSVDLCDTYDLIMRAYDAGYKTVIMEVSSHALASGRMKTLIFDYAIFTNLTQDHLDYHKTLDNYIDAKKKMFYLLKEDGISLINNDDEYCDKFKIRNYKTYGFTNSDYTINNDDYINGKKYNIPLLGHFNKYNILAALSVLFEMGYNYDNLYDLVSTLKEPSGRMEVINSGTNKIIVDYAHTPDAMINIISASKELMPNRIITIIGCGGNRDKGKRKMMGMIATDYSDYVIFTSDNPRFEDPNAILRDITISLDKNNYEIESNRENAIKRGIQLLTNNDILLVLGKGHEKYQIVKDVKISFDDKKIILENI